jgi:hypothetical protein
MRLFLPLVAGAFFSAALAEEAGVATGTKESIIKLPAALVAVYEGAVQTAQVLGKDKTEKRLPVVLIQAAPGGPGQKEILSIRLLTQDAGEKAIVTFDKAVVEAQANPNGGPTRIEATEDPPFELQDNSYGMNEYLPLDLLPPFAAPAKGQSARHEATVAVLGLAEVKLPLAISTKEEGNELELVRSLPEGTKAKFTFNDQSVDVVLWRERYVVDSQTGVLRHVERAVGIESRGEGGGDDGIQRFEKKLLLDAKKVIPFSGPEAGPISSQLKELDGILADFRSIKPSEEIAKRVEAFEKAVKGTSLEAAAKAVSVRLEAFREFFEKGDDGKALVKLLGKPAPDFKLQSLQGGDVSFREASRGKVTLLSFWGVG